jgi:hypothetical protein
MNTDEVVKGFFIALVPEASKDGMLRYADGPYKGHRVVFYSGDQAIEPLNTLRERGFPQAVLVPSYDKNPNVTGIGR